MTSTYLPIANEAHRQNTGLELIPSENYASPAVKEALGSVFTNKYSEGYPGKRYYGGQKFTDEIEILAIERAKKLFGADHANVQPLSGANANLAAYFAWCQPGDTILGMDLSHGGHLTHGHPVTHAAKIFNFVRYGIADLETGALDYDEIRNLALKHQPKIILCGFSAYPRELDYAKFKAIADEVGAVAMADISHLAGLIAAGELANPFDYGFDMVTTTTHKTLRGPRAGMILTKGIVSDPTKKTEQTKEHLPTLVDRSVFPGLQGGPHMNNIAAIAVALGEADSEEFKAYAKQTLLNAKVLSEELMKRDVKLVTNGTDNHLMLIDAITSFGISGGELERRLDKVGITANKNAIPNDERKPFDPSGLRIGTPALTTRGMKETEMKQIAEWIVGVGKKKEDMLEIKKNVKNLTVSHPGV